MTKAEECKMCGAKERLVNHHIIPIELGGSNNLNNIVVLCISCHRKVHRAMIAKAGEKMRCTNCGYEWNYKGNAPFYATCPRCLRKVKIPDPSGGDVE